MKEYPEEFLRLLESVTAKRPKTVISHILKYGHITTQELRDVYGYHHPPRAIRDVRELGIPVVMHRIPGPDGKSIAAYQFGDPAQAGNAITRHAGRSALSKAIKQALIDQYGAKCFIYLEEMEPDILQADHRVPYEIGGEPSGQDTSAFMLLCPSANRAKSWTCEHCENRIKKDTAFCMRCFWAYPEDYDHVAGKAEKVVSVLFSGNEIEDYIKLISLAGEKTAQAMIKEILHEYLESGGSL